MVLIERVKEMEILDDLVKRLDDAVNNKRIDDVLDFYEDDALLVMEPGRVAKGKTEIRDFFQFVFTLDVKAKQITTNILEVGDIALFTSKWIAEGRTPDGSSFSSENVATSVFRKSSAGKWRLIIDNSFGPEILNAKKV
jgi:uncharacterized protein (TIGR02246 family)